MLIQAEALDDTASTQQGLGTPFVPPVVSLCRFLPFPSQDARVDSGGLGDDWELNAYGHTGLVEMSPCSVHAR